MILNNINKQSKSIRLFIAAGNAVERISKFRAERENMGLRFLLYLNDYPRIPRDHIKSVSGSQSLHEVVATHMSHLIEYEIVSGSGLKTNRLNAVEQISQK
jgi:hypothetical protein